MPDIRLPVRFPFLRVTLCLNLVAYIIIYKTFNRKILVSVSSLLPDIQHTLNISSESTENILYSIKHLVLLRRSHYGTCLLYTSRCV